LLEPENPASKSSGAERGFIAGGIGICATSSVHTYARRVF